MSKAFQLGFKVGSIIRQFFTHQQPIRVEPILILEQPEPLTDKDLFSLENDTPTDRKCYEEEIKKVTDYQKKWSEKLLYSYIHEYEIKSVDDMPAPIFEAFGALFTNETYIDDMFQKIEKYDLDKLEKDGFPEVAKLLGKIYRKENDQSRTN